jgi:hypothetical protein
MKMSRLLLLPLLSVLLISSNGCKSECQREVEAICAKYKDGTKNHYKYCYNQELKRCAGWGG